MTINDIKTMNADYAALARAAWEAGDNVYAAALEEAIEAGRRLLEVRERLARTDGSKTFAALAPAV